MFLGVQNRLHVVLIGLDTWLTVRVGSNQTTFHGSSQHEHLKQFSEGILVEFWQNNVRGWTPIVCVSFVGPVERGLLDFVEA